MTSPRSQIVDPSTAGYFHCVSRCVRRAFLCGIDTYTGQSFEHRKSWVEQRIAELTQVFSISAYAYAVMSNHSHLVLYVDPDVALGWSADEVAARWVKLCPVRAKGEVDEVGCAMRACVIAANERRVSVYRARLSSLSWFMRCLNEPIARRANREDACTGRFWEGRFKCQALLDEAAVLSCMAYVDLNPVRAGIAQDLTDSAHTSVQKRIEGFVDKDDALRPVCGSNEGARLGVSAAEYLTLVDWTGRIVKPGKRGAIASTTPPILARLGFGELQWQAQVLGIESRYWRAVGSAAALLEKAKAIGQCWLKGCGVAAARRLSTVA